MRAIGGYFELELPEDKGFSLPSNCVMVNSGRHAFELILMSLGNSINRVWLPHYTCDVILEPIKRLGLDYAFYHVNVELEMEGLPQLEDGDYILVNNYFGIKDRYIDEVSKYYNDKIIVDNAQAWFAREKVKVKSFYSPRKFFGLPDGGIACLEKQFNFNMRQDLSYDRLSHLVKRIDIGPSAGYADFKKNSKVLSQTEVMAMSPLTRRLLSSIEFGRIKDKRMGNYKLLASQLNSTNMMKLPEEDSFECAMVYPYLCKHKDLRKYLISKEIFVATYWPNVQLDKIASPTEKWLCDYLVPLPIDQRYGEADMMRIVEAINEYTK